MNKTGINRKKVAKAVLFAAIFLILFYFAQRLLQAKWTGNSSSTTLWAEYVSLEKNTVDVFFVGTSHVYSGFDPMYIYENSGITSYTMSGGDLRFDLIYTILLEALKTQSPQVIFLDMSSVQYSEQAKEPKIHLMLDQLPASLAKLNFVLNSGNEKLTLLNGMIPFFRYHSRWEDLSAKDFQYMTGDMERTVTRGHFVSYKKTATGYRFYEEPEEELSEVTDYHRIPLQKIASLCEENGIDLILFKVPSPSWYLEESEASQQLADELGLPYWELFYEVDEIGLDTETDFRDANEHLNQYGAEKLSDYLMEYLDREYDLEDHRGSNERWDSDLPEYQQLADERLETQMLIDAGLLEENEEEASAEE
ncbi:MAG: hypothetical protein LUG99_07810 [Lachnospiraceae bacterium]|nr:hypothetical protein [Lachnospiraceae bacterium]